jgi:predicted nucleotide-binding protein
MSVQKVTYSRAFQVYASNFCNIPNPAAFIVSGANDSITPDALRDGTTNFLQKGVLVGDIVYNTTTGNGATVVAIIDDNTLELNADIFVATPDDYSIYGGYQNTMSNQGCILYTPSGGNTLSFYTIGGDFVSGGFVDSLVPIQAMKLTAASTNPIYALW